MSSFARHHLPFLPFHFVFPWLFPFPFSLPCVLAVIETGKRNATSMKQIAKKELTNTSSPRLWHMMLLSSSSSSSRSLVRLRRQRDLCVLRRSWRSWRALVVTWWSRRSWCISTVLGLHLALMCVYLCLRLVASILSSSCTIVAMVD